MINDSPFFNTPKSDPQKELIEPATQGTKNVLEACFENGVQDVILTSSTASVLMKVHFVVIHFPLLLSLEIPCSFLVLFSRSFLLFFSLVLFH